MRLKIEFYVRKILKGGIREFHIVLAFIMIHIFTVSKLQTTHKSFFTFSKANMREWEHPLQFNMLKLRLTCIVIAMK